MADRSLLSTVTAQQCSTRLFAKACTTHSHCIAHPDAHMYMVWSPDYTDISRESYWRIGGGKPSRHVCHAAVYDLQWCGGIPSGPSFNKSDEPHSGFQKQHTHGSHRHLRLSLTQSCTILSVMPEHLSKSCILQIVSRPAASGWSLTPQTPLKL